MTKEYWLNRKVLITGASSGLGAALVRALAKFQVHFGLLSRRIEPMQQLQSELETTGSKFFIRSCDVQNRQQVEQCVDEFVTEAGGVDVAWINSGISGDSSFRNWDWKVVDDIIDTNLKGAMYTTMACLRQMMLKKSGTIVAISSAAAMRGLPARGIYSMTKIGLEAFIESLATEIAEIQFTTIYPGFVDTPINQNNSRRFWLMQPDKAAHLMISAVEKRKKVYVYPFRMALLFHAVRALPTFLYRPLARRLINLSKP